MDIAGIAMLNRLATETNQGCSMNFHKEWIYNQFCIINLTHYIFSGSDIHAGNSIKDVK